MQTNRYQANLPKTRKAASQLLATILTFQDSIRKKRENLMINREQTLRKMQKLQKTLDELEKQISQAEASEKMNQEFIDSLLTQWQLTEAEILEIKSESLRSQIKALEKQKLLKQTGTKLT